MRAAPWRRLPAYLIPALALLALAAALLWLQPADPARAQDEPSGPTITAGPTITSSPTSGDTYRQGEAITVALTFSEPVSVTGKPRLRLKIGDDKRWAKYADGSGSATLSFSHAVKADDQDADGIAIGKNQLKLNKGTIADADGNPANLKHPKLADQAAHKVDGAPDEPAQPEPEPANNAPQFPGDTATRSVDENTPAGASIGDPVAATDADGDTLTYALTGSDAGAFDFETDTGQIKVKDTLDYEDKASYSVTVTVHDGKNADSEADTGVDDSIAVTISVANVDEAGQVFLDPMEPVVGSALSARVFDPDGGVTGESWTWESSADGMAWTTVAGATEAAYTPVDGDAGRYLRASAAYADAQGTGKSARSDAAGPVTGISRQILANAAPQFAADTAARSVDENTPAGTSVGAPVVAIDEDDDTLTYALTGSDAFTIDASGQIAVASGAVLDYETQASHTVTVSVNDGKNAAGEADTGVDDSIAVTISVVNVDEPGVVRLSTDTPQAGSALIATVTDPDGIVEGSIVWQWKRSPDGTTAGNVDTTNFNDIGGPGGEIILLTEADDAGRWLRALARYTDAFGATKARAQTANPVASAPGQPPQLQQQQPANNAPQFAADTAARSVDENTPAGTSLGDPITATDGDGDTLTYAMSGSDAFTIDASGQIAVASGADLDYETQASYTLTVSVHDGKNAQGEADTGVDDSIAVTISVVNLNEPGVVSLSLDQPLVGSALTATVLDPDGVVDGTVVWQWKRSPDGTTADNVDRTDFPNIAGATEQSFLLTDGDAGRWLRALAIYTDAFGEGQRARAQTANPALAPAPPERQPQNAPDEQTVPFGWSLIPAGVNPGNKFRLLFVDDSNFRDAQSTNIADYNGIIQGAANSIPVLQPYKDGFRMVGSTQAVDARDNTDTRYTGDTTTTESDDSDLGVPIYWVEGAKVADHYKDFWDGNWASQKARTQSGNTITNVADRRIWTGSESNGVEDTDNWLGAARPIAGKMVSGSEIKDTHFAKTETMNRHFYGLSQVFTVAQQPTADDCLEGGAIDVPDRLKTSLSSSEIKELFKEQAKDCATLLAMKSKLEGTGGATLNWSTSVPINNWDGVSAGLLGVLELHLSGKDLRGVVPGALNKLDQLTHIELADNKLTGPIPAKLGDLGELQVLDLSDNRLTGNIPGKLGDLTKLRILNLANQRGVTRVWDVNGPYTIGSRTGPNVGRKYRFDTSYRGLTGTIPGALWQLTSLERLILSDNAFSGTLPTPLTELPKLKQLGLRFSGLGGVIPSNIGCKFPSLETLDLQFNKFSGQIPGSLSRVSSLYWMAFAYNDFTGVYPQSFRSLRSIPSTHFDVDRRQLGLEWGAAPADPNCGQPIARSYGQKRCEDYLGGTWVPRGTDGYIVSRCSLSAHRVSFSTETTAEIFVSRTGFTVTHPDDRTLEGDQRQIAVYQRASEPKIVTVTGNEGERAKEKKWMYNASQVPVKFKVHWIRHSEEAFKTNYAAAGRALVVPGTWKTTKTWHKCTRRDVPGLSPQWDCEVFPRNLAFKYGDPNWIPKWDTLAQKAWDDYKRDGTVTPEP